MRNILITIFTLISCGLYGQNYSYVDKFYVIESREEEYEEELTAEPQEYDLEPLLALKTNLLFDAMTMINVEIEFPITERWSVAGELIFPWWRMDNGKANSKRNRLQLLNGNLEGRYWWGERESRPLLTGWFTGAYVGVGEYDFEYHARGYQGDASFTGGVSGGYAHPINRAGNLRLEYSLGIGYMTTFYHYYEAEFCVNEYWHAIERRNGRYKWFGPTRAKVSLSWLIDCKVKR
ncbi:MAG: DUF3575 domain-containing protein [Rikenellaceae bacterium]